MQSQGQHVDFFQYDGSAFGAFEDGLRIGAVAAAEEFLLQEILGERRAVQHFKWRIVTAAVVMQGAGNHLFA